MSRISANVIFCGRADMPEHLHRIIGSRHDLELCNGPWRALARRRIVDAVAGMHVVQRHPLLRLEVLRRVGRSTGIRADGSDLRGLGRLYRNHAIEAVNLGHHALFGEGRRG
jgi:hypothetical protein